MELKLRDFFFLPKMYVFVCVCVSCGLQFEILPTKTVFTFRLNNMICIKKQVTCIGCSFYLGGGMTKMQYFS
jgi:hypothetical protein